MLLWRNVIFIVAMATICRTVSSQDWQNGPEAKLRERRFLFWNQNFTTQNFLQPSSSINGGIFLDRPCNPAVRHCRLQCTYGFLEGTNGCQYCDCQTTNATRQPSILVPTTLTNSERTASASLSSLATTRFPLSSKGSVHLYTVTQPTAVPTTRSPSEQIGNFNDPCISSQKTCDKTCEGNYVKGPGGCQYCLCATNIAKGPRLTTTAPGRGKLTKNSTVPHYLDLTATSESCIMAKVICNQKCEHGFISHPNDCLYCSCQKLTDGDVPVYDEPYSFSVTLPNPCVQASVICGLKCLNGYVMGPRDCQFCSCRS